MILNLLQWIIHFDVSTSRIASIKNDIESMIFKITVQTNEMLKHYQSKKVEGKKQKKRSKKKVDIQKTQNTMM